MGDIGQLFPDTDERWREADSIALLAEVELLLSGRGWEVRNLDATVICQAPTLGPHRESMCARLAAAVGLEAGAVSVKFTTNEGMGFVGRGEGIAAMAVASVERARPDAAEPIGGDRGGHA
jgi:2-C-methyl-D-erythritol 2,4-cyclodiphosphate synthase